MDERMTAGHWQRIEALLDEALTLPPGEREALLLRRAGGDDALLHRVRALLASAHTRGDLLDRPAVETLVAPPVLPSLSAGARLGAWRVLELVGRGGMGEVYRAERADGQFQQQAALKLVRREAIEHSGRFESERRMLARLDHPGIARLLDGGLADDGRPWMVMEWVDGQPITAWCRERHADLRSRLDLLLQVCDAVAYAHRNLLVHRDLKPDNVLVTADGRCKLLDFGIAKLLTAGAEDSTLTQAPLTPAYAAPEQLAQGAVTTATDVYALGLLLYELLTGERPWPARSSSLALLLDQQRGSLPQPSRAAAKSAQPPLPPRLLRGDLDAIVGRCLRAEPEYRYGASADLAADLRRYLEGQPVAAREGTRSYLVGRFLRRYRWGVAAVALLILTLAAGLLGVAWQARLAEAQARRAQAVQAFLTDMFRASDPRIAQDKPRGQITAKELLDLNAPRIATEFAGDADVQIDLLGVTASIYRELGEDERYRALHRQQLDIARTRYGELHPAIVNGLLDDADHATDANDYAGAMKLLTQADGLIRRAGLDRSATRARWYLIRSDVMLDDDAGRKAGNEALDHAAKLFEEVAPQDPGYVKALTSLGYRNLGKDPPESERYFLKAVAVAQAGGARNDPVLQQLTWPGIAANRENRGDYAGAEQAYQNSADLARKTYGEAHSTAWVPAAEQAWMAHRQGERARAHQLFDHLLSLIPANWTADSYGQYAREYYASCLAAEGRAQEAIPILEEALRFYIAHPGVEFEQRRNRLILGDAYDRAGRTAEARAALKSSLDERLAKEPPEGGNVRAARERWGRFLLEQQDLAGAEEQFRAVLAAERGRKFIGFALAHADMAQLALARHDLPAALQESAAATAIFDQVVARRDVRSGPAIWLIRSEVLRQSGDLKGALQWAQRARAASRQYDDPAAPSIAQAEKAVKAAGQI